MSKEINKDIEVGDYVRTNDGLIFKIFTKTKTTYGFCGLTDSSNKKYSTYTYGKGNCIDNNIKGKIVKHSKNIIDLIEVGDLLFINDFSYYNFIYIYDETMLEDLKEVVKKDIKIKQILTHEQYMQNCYTVEREEKC